MAQALNIAHLISALSGMSALSLLHLNGNEVTQLELDPSNSLVNFITSPSPSIIGEDPEGVLPPTMAELLDGFDLKDILDYIAARVQTLPPEELAAASASPWVLAKAAAETALHHNGEVESSAVGTETLPQGNALNEALAQTADLIRQPEDGTGGTGDAGSTISPDPDADGDGTLSQAELDELDKSLGLNEEAKKDA